MIKRLLSSTILIVIITTLLALFGNYGCVGILIVSSVGTQIEFYRLLKKFHKRPLIPLGTLSGLLIMLNSVFGPSTSFSNVEILFLSTMIVVLIAIMTHSLDGIKNIIIPTIIGILYVPVLCCFPITFLVSLREKGITAAIGIFTLFWVIIVSKCSDIGGMLAGKYFGKHKLAPNFSPKKTIEGMLGGILLSNFVGIILALKYSHLLPFRLSAVKISLLASMLAILALMGDLLESSIKRMANEKDSGRTIPGIGGIFDLTDSVIFSLPFGVIFITHWCM